MNSKKVYFMLRLHAKIKVFIAFLLIISACNDIENSVNPTQQHVKSETKWKCDANGNKIYKIYVKEYDQKDQIIRITEFDDKGQTSTIKSVDYSDVNSKEILDIYNSKGQVDSTVITLNSYDIKGNITYKITQSISGDTLFAYNYQYDNSGKLISTIGKIKNTVGFSSVEIKYTYNDNGSLKERVQQDLVSGSLQKKDNFNYQLDNKTIEKVTTNSGGGIENIYTYIYNNLGLIYKEFESDPQGKIINLFVYDYMYF